MATKKQKTDDDKLEVPGPGQVLGEPTRNERDERDDVPTTQPDDPAHDPGE